jgi:hypothetical protein
LGRGGDDYLLQRMLQKQQFLHLLVFFLNLRFPAASPRYLCDTADPQDHLPLEDLAQTLLVDQRQLLVRWAEVAVSLELAALGFRPLGVCLSHNLQFLRPSVDLHPVRPVAQGRILLPKNLVQHLQSFYREVAFGIQPCGSPRPEGSKKVAAY